MVLHSNNKLKQNLDFGSNTYMYGNNNTIDPQLNAVYPKEMFAYNLQPRLPLNFNFPHSTHPSLNIDGSSAIQTVHNLYHDPFRLNSAYSNHSASSLSMKNSNVVMANSSSTGGMIYNNNIMNSCVQPPRDANPHKQRVIIQEIGPSVLGNILINGSKTIDDLKAKRKNANVSKINVKKGYWIPEEDRMLREFVAKRGKNKWSQIAQMMPGRQGKQLRERYNNHLKPGLKKDAWTRDEDMQLIEAHARLGNKWTEIAKILVGRSEGDIKNRWNAAKRKCLNAIKKSNNEGKPSSAFEEYVKNIINKTDQNNAASAESRTMEDRTSEHGSSAVNQGFPNGPLGVENVPVGDNGLGSTFGPNMQEPFPNFDMSVLEMLYQS